MTEILKILVLITGFATVGNGEHTVNMILFDGICDSPYFTGRVLPGGVDTQVYNPDGGTLSARYILEGVDCAGDSCRIFVENKAVAGDTITHPWIVTDSEALRFLNDAPLQGRIASDSTSLTIHISAQLAQ